MTYQEEAEALRPHMVEALTRTLDLIAGIDPKARPGHPAYASKETIVSLARAAIESARASIEATK